MAENWRTGHEIEAPWETSLRGEDAVRALCRRSAFLRGRAEAGFREGRGLASPRSLTGVERPARRLESCFRHVWYQGRTLRSRSPACSGCTERQCGCPPAQVTAGGLSVPAAGVAHRCDRTNSTACIKSRPGTAPLHCLLNGGACLQGGRGGRSRPLLELLGGPVDTDSCDCRKGQRQWRSRSFVCDRQTPRLET